MKKFRMLLCLTILVLILLGSLREVRLQKEYIADLHAYIRQLENPTVIERLKRLQRQVSCEMIDARIGPETIDKVNLAVEAEQRVLFTEYAEKFMTESGAPE